MVHASMRAGAAAAAQADAPSAAPGRDTDMAEADEAAPAPASRHAGRRASAGGVSQPPALPGSSGGVGGAAAGVSAGKINAGAHQETSGGIWSHVKAAIDPNAVLRHSVGHAWSHIPLTSRACSGCP